MASLLVNATLSLSEKTQEIQVLSYDECCFQNSVEIISDLVEKLPDYLIFLLIWGVQDDDYFVL